MTEDTSKPGLQGAVFRPTRAGGRFDQRRPQPAVALPRLAGLVLAGALVVARTQSRPAREMRRRGKRAHVHADLRDDDLRRPPVDAGNAIQSIQLFRKRGEMLLDFRAERADRFLKV